MEEAANSISIQLRTWHNDGGIENLHFHMCLLILPSSNDASQRKHGYVCVMGHIRNCRGTSTPVCRWADGPGNNTEDHSAVAEPLR